VRHKAYRAIRYRQDMRSIVTLECDLTDLERAVGQAAYGRGVQYARQQRVRRIQWSPQDSVLVGSVLGSGDLYTTTAYFSRRGASLRFDEGECSCPVGFDCKHVVALVLSATGVERQPAPAAPPTWQQSLGALLEPRLDDPLSQSNAVPLAIELTLSATAPPRYGSSTAAPTLRVLARLVKPGKNGWVGAIQWSRLGSSHYHREYNPSHVRLLQEMYALYRAHTDQSDPYYHHHDDKSIDLSTFGSLRLWTLLDDAEQIGIRLVHGKKRLGDIGRYDQAQLCVDVTREASGALAVVAVLHVADRDIDAAPFRFIGSGGHGVVYVDRADIQASADHGDWRVRLARLTTPASPHLQQMALRNARLEIPAADEPRFRDEYYPRLRHTATVISSDESFVPPRISLPTLVLTASYGTDHSLDLSWAWTYEVGDTALRVPPHADSSDAGYRDAAQERAILADLDMPTDLAGGLTSGTLTGMDTMRFTTEVLPLLADRPGVAVEVSGNPVDYREAGDSLTIGVSTDDIPGDTDWFDLGVSITVEGRQVPFTDVFLALSSGQSHMLLADGAYFSLRKTELQTLRGLIEEARALGDSPDGPLRISRFQVGLWAELAELGVVDHQATAWQRQVAGLLSVDTVEPAGPPATLAARLRPYQLEGFGWLAFLWQFRLGGILADDMGLGKTLQSLALICHVKQTDPVLPPFLIVAPTSVVSNWTAESARFAPGLKVASIIDTTRRRGADLAEVAAGADVVVTSYTLFRLEFDAYQEVSWAGLLLDEAQSAKNHQSKIYQCVRRLLVPFKLAITGTPMENNLMELWSLLSITAPGLFPNPTRFRDYYARAIEKQSDADLLAQLRRRIKPLIKRRTKEQVAADLPAKQEQVLEIELHPRHRKLYQTHLQRERQKVLGLIADMNTNRFTILRSLTLLRQLSLHPGLIDDAHGALPCAKIDALVEQLHDVVAGGHRALVFSQFTGFLAQVRAALDAEDMPYCYLDGKTRDRGAVVKRFKDGTVPVFLISLKAGGFGLNLAEADYCFLLDPWWNPATEAQAVDRTHRIGQTRNVMVYRLIAKDTIEEKVMALKERKAELFASVMDDGNVFDTSLTAEDIRVLLA
jgi:SNF2-related domain/Helicase conserved C-terminal domain/SWIM zinc finger